MKTFATGALRPADDGARAARIAAANDLVRRTLSQHGLLADGKAPAGGRATSGTVLGSLGGSFFQVPVLSVPDGAAFRTGTFEGRSGSRAYRTYVPASAGEGVTGIVMMLHGCTQTPEDFATGTGMNALAEDGRFVVIYPEQSRGANAQTCWNWFSKGDQRRGRGEPEILAGIAAAAATEHGVGPDRTFVAGLSAGGAMAVILGETYPDVFGAIGVHSGLPFGAASDVPSAFAAMAGNAGPEPAGKPSCSGLRTIVFHGDADRTVHPKNGAAVARHAKSRGPDVTIEQDETLVVGARTVKRLVTTDTQGLPLTESWNVAGLGHAWSGGQPGGSYTDAAGPDASAEMVRFFFQTSQGEK